MRSPLHQTPPPAPPRPPRPASGPGTACVRRWTRWCSWMTAPRWRSRGEQVPGAPQLRPGPRRRPVAARPGTGLPGTPVAVVVDPHRWTRTRRWRDGACLSKKGPWLPCFPACQASNERHLVSRVVSHLLLVCAVSQAVRGGGAERKPSVGGCGTGHNSSDAARAWRRLLPFPARRRPHNRRRWRWRRQWGASASPPVPACGWRGALHGR